MTLREELQAGDELHRMPCNKLHAFHPVCLKPWLAQNNSCPLCNHELETDDLEYEARKAKLLQETMDRKGAANAVSHNDFMYI